MNPNSVFKAFGSFAALPPVRWIERRPDVVLAVCVAFLVGMLLFPMPTVLIDGLIAINIAASMMVLLTALFAKNVLEVTSFPSLLLITTLFRLGLNVSVTRGILAHAEAGSMVKAFGKFVVDGDLVVGLVIFLVVTLVQFLVVAKGAERVAEVGARFTLDAMPGKQMSIDAALRSGTLTEEEAQEKRDELGRACQMFGNMDGAMKFVKGDTIAGLVITGINLVGGLLIGVFRTGMDVRSALDVYSTLTIGDALVAQISALLITLASGILVTRVEAKDKTKNLGHSVKDEILSNTKVLFIGGALMGVLALIPGLPALPFFLCGGLAFIWGVTRMIFPVLALQNSGIFPAEMLKNMPAGMDINAMLQQVGLPPGALPKDLQKLMNDKLIDKKVEEAKQQKAIADTLSPSVVPIGIDIDPVLSLAIGFMDAENDDAADLVRAYIPQLRDALYLETGVRFPGVRVRPHVKSLPESTFVVRVNDVPVLQEKIPSNMCLATTPPEKLARFAIDAKPILHPISKAKMSLIHPDQKDVVEAAGITVWNTSGMVALYVASVLRAKAKLFIGIQEVNELMERLEKAYPALVKEVVPKVATLQQLVQVLRRLVDENVSIRDLKSIVEALAEYGQKEGDSLWLTERVRTALGPQLAFASAGIENRMPVVMLDPMIEDTIQSAIHQTPSGLTLTLDSDICRQVIIAIAESLQPVVASGKRPVILTNSEIRRFVRKLIETDLPQVAVLSFDELPGDLTIQPMGRAQIAAEAA
jgi:type III secretion protein V